MVSMQTALRLSLRHNAIQIIQILDHFVTEDFVKLRINARHCNLCHSLRCFNGSRRFGHSSQLDALSFRHALCLLDYQTNSIQRNARLALQGIQKLAE